MQCGGRVKASGEDKRYAVRSTFSGSLVHKKNFDKQFSSEHNYFVKGGRIPLLRLNKLGDKSCTAIFSIIL